MVFIVGEKRIPLSDASAQYALANMIYYAQAQGIGSCLCGNGPLFFDRDKRVRKRLKIQNREHILGALFLGYPAIKFMNKVDGKVMPIQWIDSCFLQVGIPHFCKIFSPAPVGKIWLT
jgi:nitroreductase